MIPVAAVLAFAIGLFVYRNMNPAQAPAPSTASVQPAAADDDGAQDDQQVLDLVAQQQPTMRDHFEQNLRSVNAYIRDAKSTLQQNPDDNEAKQYLMQAYEQKAMLYQMATRTGE